MLGNQLSSLCLGLCASAALLTGCSSTQIDPKADWSPSRIYAEAKDELSSGAYDKAVPLLERLEGRAAGTALAQQAQLDKAYAQFKNAEPVLAIATLDRFIKQHPASPAIDYALYLKGIINFNDDLGILSGFTRQDLAERDQKAAKESFESFKELVGRFPQSRYAADATARMIFIVNLLAKSEVYVAHYYFDRGAYVAAINRAQSTIKDYPNAPALEEALFILMQSYGAMGLDKLRDDSRRVLEKNFPATPYLTQGGAVKANSWWKFW